MKKLLLIIAAFALSAAAFGASIDGKWTMEQKAKDQTVIITFNLKSSDGAITGDMTRAGKRRNGRQDRHAQDRQEQFSHGDGIA